MDFAKHRDMSAFGSVNFVITRLRSEMINNIRMPPGKRHVSSINVIITSVPSVTANGRHHALSAPNCITHFHWTIHLFWPIRFDVTIVSSGNNCNAKPD